MHSTVCTHAAPSSCPARTPPQARAQPTSLLLVVADAFTWPDDVEILVLNLRRRLLTQRHEHVRRAAAVVLQRKMLTKLVRRWFVYRDMPALVSSTEPARSPLLWPHSVAMSVSWPVVCAARPGTLVFGRRVMLRGEWQLIVVAAAQRGESVALLW